MKKILLPVCAILMLGFASCSKDDDNQEEMKTPTPVPKDITKAEKVSVDRFSTEAGMLFVRDGSNGLPEANEAINMDEAPFITKGLGPDGSMVEYYNFDVMPLEPANIYVLFKEGSSTPVAGQHNIVSTIPGDEGYSDFWLVNKVTVPASYVANTFYSESQIMNSGYAIEPTTKIVNCPIVPFGSTASKKYGGGSSELVMGWYKSKAVAYFSFEEKDLETTGGKVPVSPIYVMFNDNDAGPSSGFRTEMGTDQTHNVVATTPTDADYSPLWFVNVVDNADFDNVTDLTSAKAANILAVGVANVNCPIVK